MKELKSPSGKHATDPLFLDEVSPLQEDKKGKEKEANGTKTEHPLREKKGKRQVSGGNVNGSIKTEGNGGWGKQPHPGRQEKPPEKPHAGGGSKPNNSAG